MCPCFMAREYTNLLCSFSLVLDYEKAEIWLHAYRRQIHALKIPECISDSTVVQ